jgi:Protein of unknown function (DUF3046)
MPATTKSARAGCSPAAARELGTLAGVRITEFWGRMNRQFGDAYAESVARDHVVAGLGGRTVAAALAAGDDPKDVWRAVCDEFHLPARDR